MKDSILLENARREIARMGGIQVPEAQSSQSAPTAFPHTGFPLPHVSVAHPHRAIVNGQ